jgi:tRNA pseudouridine32 synthase/23S rRNA pseudouridine746 synthase
MNWIVLENKCWNCLDLMTLEEIQKRILYRDAMILALNKPAGFAVHPGKGSKENLEIFFKDLSFGLPQPPALAHRLDAATSGCLILGRHRQALIKLGKMFENGTIEKVYWAVVKGTPSDDQGIIDLPLAKQSSRKDQWWMKVDSAGKPSKTAYRVLGKGEGITWLELKPITGRTHQLRVHCAAIGCEIIGDQVYGSVKSAKPLHLHAYSIKIPLYPKKEPVFIEAPIPDHMLEMLKDCGYN